MEEQQPAVTPVTPPDPSGATRGAVEAVETIFRIESPRIIAGVSRIVRDVGIAEELAQDALVAALEQWPRTASRTTRAPG